MKNLEASHHLYDSSPLEIIPAHRSGTPAVDAQSEESLEHAFSQWGQVDAVVTAFGDTVWSADPTVDDYLSSWSDKAAAQIRVAVIAAKHLKPGGSITMISGIVGSHAHGGIPAPAGSPSATANAIIDSFVGTWEVPVKAGLRINAVRLPVISESYEGFAPFFPGQPVLPGVEAL